MKWRGRIVIITTVLLLVLASGFFCFINWLTQPSQPEFGVTFSTIYTQNLGLNVQETYLALVNDLKVRRIRLPVYWSEIEPQRGVFNWETLDFLVAEAEKNQVKLIMAIGRKVPRWPECFIPDWAEGLTNEDAKEALLKMERTVVERYKNSLAVESWQIENEAFFPFGVCPVSNQSLFDEEISLVRSLDQRPIMITVSGELDPWLDMAQQADILGISMYRVSWNPVLGLFPYPMPALVYRWRSLLAAPLVDKLVVSELQAEPWFTKSIGDLTDWERAEAFTVDDLENNLNFVALTGAQEVYLWGAEWWYLEKTSGRPELWEAAKKIFLNN